MTTRIDERASTGNRPSICGPVADGCGGILNCGTCCAPETCEQACGAESGFAPYCSAAYDPATYPLACPMPNGCGGELCCFCKSG